MRALGPVIAVLFMFACVGEDVSTTPSSSSSSGSTSSGGGPSARQVQCNDKRCDTGLVCCLTFGDSTIEKAECTPKDSCTTGALVCDDKTDCLAGEVCCVKTGGFSVQYGPSYCAKDCQSDPSNLQLCRDSSECANGRSCVPSQGAVTPLNLFVCDE